MPRRILIADEPRDTERIRSVLENDEISVVACHSGAEAAACLHKAEQDWVALIILWELLGPPSGAELLLRAKTLLPEVPVVVVSNALDIELAARAYALGARDFLETPLDLERVKASLYSLIGEQVPDVPLVGELNQTIVGSSRALLSTLREVAQVAQHPDARVLLIGESGTGKELIAQELHRLWKREPIVAINVAAIPGDLIESHMFGHEQGAFTHGAKQHQGYMEQAGQGTLFLDEIGALDRSLQAKFLRAIQERKFFRLKGKEEVSFLARLICATSRDLAQAVHDKTFDAALYHRIAEVEIKLPPLRERLGDVGVLLPHFLAVHSGDRPVSFARETLTILKSYAFNTGNVRELENIVTGALIRCDGPLILPSHLPLPTMGTFLGHNDQALDNQTDHVPGSQEGNGNDWLNDGNRDLFYELEQHLPADWRELPYRRVRECYEKAIDRIYLQFLFDRHDHNVSRSSKAAGLDHKTFRKRWKNAELPPLRPEDAESND